MSWRAAAIAATLAAVISPQLALAGGARLSASPPAGTQPAGRSGSSSPSSAGSPAQQPGTPRWDPKLEWPLVSLDADSLWRAALGAGIKIAVVDTGIDGTRPDLVGAVSDTINLTSGPSTDVSADSHGTAIAGLIAGRGRSAMAGLAPQALLISVKVAAQPNEATPAEIAAGIRNAAEAGAEIINVSIGTPHDDKALAQAVAFAQARGCLIVASAGDTGAPQYPAGDSGVVSVYAISQSNVPVPRSGTGAGTPVSIYAPGADLFSTGRTGSANDGYRHDIGGSDYATAFVSAAAALLLSADKRVSPAQAGNLLVTRTVPVSGGVAHVGALNPAAVLSYLALTPTPAPTSTPVPTPQPTAAHGPGGARFEVSGILDGVLIVAAVILGVLIGVAVITVRGRPPSPPQGQPQDQVPHEPSSWDQTW